MAIRLPCRSLTVLIGRILGHAEHPADRPAADLREDQLGHLVHVGPVLHDPVVAGQAGVEHAVFDVAGHLLGADQQALDLVVVDRRIVAPRAERDLVAGAAKQFGRGLLQAAGGNSKFQEIGHGTFVECIASRKTAIATRAVYFFFVHFGRDRTPARRRPSGPRA